MIDHEGIQIIDPDAMPGLKPYEFDNVLQFHVVIKDILFNKKQEKLTTTIIIKPKGRRFPLGYAKEDFENKDSLFFIRKNDKDYSHTSGGHIYFPITDVDKVKTYLQASK